MWQRGYTAEGGGGRRAAKAVLGDTQAGGECTGRWRQAGGSEGFATVLARDFGE